MSLFLLCQKNQIASVIIKYKVVQTGAKTQSGGLKFDFTNSEYQGSFRFIVIKPPINEAEYVTVKNRTNDRNFFFNI